MGPRDVEAICPEQEVSPITTDDKELLFYALKQPAIMNAVCDAIGIEHKPSEAADCHSSWRIGDFMPPCGAGVPVYVSIQEGFNELDVVVKSSCLLHSEPIVLMTPSRRWISAASEQMLEQRRSVFMAMEEELAFADNGKIQAKNRKGYLFRKLLPEGLRTTPNTGAAGKYAFKPVKLFLSPGRRVRVSYSFAGFTSSTHLRFGSVQKRHNGRPSSHCHEGRWVDVADGRYIKECRCQIAELDRSIMEAEQFNDPGRRARLQREKDQLLEQIKELIGSGGALRKLDDPLKRPRDAVTKATRWTTKNIRGAGMNGLADHVGNSIVNGKEMIYKPLAEICWDTTPIIE